MTRPLIALGTAQLTTAYGVTNQRRTDPSEREGLALLHRAAESGIGLVDTAPAYGGAEHVIGRSPDRFLVHTKIRRGVNVAASLAASRRALGGQVLEVLYLHDPDAVLDPDGAVLTEARRATADGDVVLGASIYDEEQFEAALRDPDIAVVQVPGNVLDRRFTGDALKRAAASGTQVVLRSVLLQGVLAADPDRLPPTVEHLAPWVSAFSEVARDHRVEPLTAALGWVLQLSGVHAVVIGAASPADLDGLLRAVAVELDAAIVADLESLVQPEARACDPRTWAA